MDFAGIFNTLASAFPALGDFTHAHPALALGAALVLALLADVAAGYLVARKLKSFDKTQAFRFLQTQFATKTATALAVLLFAQASTPGQTSAAFSAFFLLVGLPKLYQLLGDIRDKLAFLSGVAASPPLPSGA